MLAAHARRAGGWPAGVCRRVGLSRWARVLAGLADRLQPDGALYLGAAETAMGMATRLVPLAGERGVYGLAEEGARLRA